MDVIVTGTGCPIPDGHRAGPGVLVRTAGLALQFDVGRGTLERLVRCGVTPNDLSAIFLTHHHSDHTMGLPDLAHSRWLQGSDGPESALPICTPSGPCESFLAAALEPFREDVSVRKVVNGRLSQPAFNVSTFQATDRIQQVWSWGDVRVSSIAVHHEPVKPAVGYRVDSPGGTVVISGDTRACEEIVELSQGADVLVHEAIRKTVVDRWKKRAILDYHTDCNGLGKLAERAGVRNLIATHLIPPPTSIGQAEEFAREIREGGFTGQLLIADDLAGFDLSQARFQVEPGSRTSLAFEDRRDSVEQQGVENFLVDP